MSAAASHTPAAPGAGRGGPEAKEEGTAPHQQQRHQQHQQQGAGGDSEPLAEHAAASYRQADEDEMLAALKAEARSRTISYHSDTGGHDPPRNSPPSLASGAFGKYAAAVAANRHMSPLAVMSGVKVPAPRDALPGEEEVAARLAAEAAAAYEAEKAAGGGAVPRSGVASKLQSAADKFARMVAMDKECPPPSSPVTPQLRQSQQQGEQQEEQQPGGAVAASGGGSGGGEGGGGGAGEVQEEEAAGGGGGLRA
ncbi:hypothetical protein HYH02_014469 [Chlamydomonas schloesseri]|uniref:Uncharacterized protein n=1 Tax=Chlamydomonas schloesseri TaxID=2026947 RepID=A0A835SJ41_9CHLO|nr:hypothetical protein HYH02_014469 [Chlamydomonas schloesseri]|eukprot:KAG2428078.1 hypothetical protein HYH02_014469 [Chlamydomonas schloesseri]